MAAFGIVEFVARLAVVEGEKAAAEVQGFELHDDGQRRGVQLAETTVFVEQLRHESGEGDKVDRIDPLCGQGRQLGQKRQFCQYRHHSSPAKAWCSSGFFNVSSAASFRRKCIPLNSYQGFAKSQMFR